MKRVSVGVVLALLLSSTPARAVPPVVGPGSHPMWVSLGFGPAIGMADGRGDIESNGQVLARDVPLDAPTQFKLIEEFGFHFRGQAEGPAFALELQESFGDDAFTFQVGPKFVWDFAIIDKLGLYLSPSLLIGYVHIASTRDLPPGVSAGSDGLTIRFGFEGKLILADRALIFFRPISLDINTFEAAVYYRGASASGWFTILRWDMIFGGGVIF